MEKNEINNIASTWIQNAETFWAWNKLHEIVSESHDKAWPIVIEIAKNSDSNEVLGSLAAGPLEDMLCAHGDVYYELVEKNANDVFNFKRALLMGININGEGSEKIKKLIAKIGDESVRDGWNQYL